MTGGAVRLGRAITLMLSEQGCNVVIHYRQSKDEARATASMAEANGVKAFIAEADLADPEGPEDLFQKAVSAAGPIDILINNASIFTSDHIADLDMKDLHRIIDINAMAPFLLSRKMAGQKRPGSVIINLLDTRICDYDREHVSYHLSKRMLFSLTRMMAMELAPDVRVNGVAPGLILPPSGQTQDYLDRLAHTNPLLRTGSPQDITDAVLYLCKAEFVTGQVIHVDGGRHMKGCMYG